MDCFGNFKAGTGVDYYLNSGKYSMLFFRVDVLYIYMVLVIVK